MLTVTYAFSMSVLKINVDGDAIQRALDAVIAEIHTSGDWQRVESDIPLYIQLIAKLSMLIKSTNDAGVHIF